MNKPKFPQKPSDPGLPGNLFLYLRDDAWADTWVNGGKVPLSPASNYRREEDERSGIFTPDEVRHVSLDGFDAPTEKFVESIMSTLPPMVQFKDVSWFDGTNSGRLDGYVMQQDRNSLILCFASIFSRKLLNRFGDKNAVVRVIDPRRLLTILGEQIGVPTQYRRIQYTSGPRRNTFLKSKADAWQHEVRMAWFPEVVETRWVVLPPGIAVKLDIAQAGNVEFDPRDQYESDFDRWALENDQFWEDVNEWNWWHHNNPSPSPEPILPRPHHTHPIAFPTDAHGQFSATQLPNRAERRRAAAKKRRLK
jgi:hypothetical protein